MELSCLLAAFVFDLATSADPAQTAHCYQVSFLVTSPKKKDKW